METQAEPRLGGASPSFCPPEDRCPRGVGPPLGRGRS